MKEQLNVTSTGKVFEPYNPYSEKLNPCRQVNRNRNANKKKSHEILTKFWLE